MLIVERKDDVISLLMLRSRKENVYIDKACFYEKLRPNELHAIAVDSS